MKKPTKPGPAKKPPPPWQPVPVAVQIRQHQAALKAAKTRKVRAAAAKKHPKPTAVKKPPVKRKLALGESVACCAAQALGTLLGWGWDDVLALYWRTASDPDSGASILATLEAARDQRRNVLPFWGLSPAWVTTWPLATADSTRVAIPAQQAGSTSLPALILGVDLPGPHAVAVTPDGTWWSWGEPFNPADWPDAVIEEAWAVTWPS